MAAEKLNLDIQQGVTYTLELNLSDDNQDPINLTAKTFSGKAKNKVTDANEQFSFTFEKADQGTDPGKVNMILAHGASSALKLERIPKNGEFHELVYDVEMVDDATSEPTRLLEGKIFLSPEVTK